MPIRAVCKDDLPNVFEMIVELATSEKLESEVTLSLEQFVKDFEAGCIKGFIVIDDETEKPAGMVTYSSRYDCWIGKTMYMNELLVRQEYRKKRYGKLLWAAVAKVAGVLEEKNDEGFLRYKMTREGIEQFVANNFSNNV